MNIKTIKVKDLTLESDMLDSNDVIQKLDSLDNRLSDIVIGSQIDISQIVSYLRNIIDRFSKTVLFEITIQVTNEDIKNCKNFVYFPTFVSKNRSYISVKWDANSNEIYYDENQYIYHKYESENEYKITITCNDIYDLYFCNFASNAHKLNMDQNTDQNININAEIEKTFIEEIENNQILKHSIDDEEISQNIFDKNKLISANKTVVCIGSKVKKICKNAFKDNKQLYNVFFNGDFRSNDLIIENESFSGCTKLIGNIILPDNCVEIQEDAFANSYNINSIVIPKKCIKIGKGAFFNVVNLKYFIFKDRTVKEANDFIQQNSIDIGDGEYRCKWFLKNNVEPINIIDDEQLLIYKQNFLNNLKADFSEIQKEYLFRYHVLDDIKKYDYQPNSFKYLKFLMNICSDYFEQNKDFIYESALINTTKILNSDFKNINDIKEYRRKLLLSNGYGCQSEYGHKCILLSDNCSLVLLNGCIIASRDECTDKSQHSCSGISERHDCGSDDKSCGGTGKTSNYCRSEDSKNCYDSAQFGCIEPNKYECTDNSKNVCDGWGSEINNCPVNHINECNKSDQFSCTEIHKDECSFPALDFYCAISYCCMSKNACIPEDGYDCPEEMKYSCGSGIEVGCTDKSKDGCTNDAIDGCKPTQDKHDCLQSKRDACIDSTDVGCREKKTCNPPTSNPCEDRFRYNCGREQQYECTRQTLHACTKDQQHGCENDGYTNYCKYSEKNECTIPASFVCNGIPENKCLNQTKNICTKIASNTCDSVSYNVCENSNSCKEQTNVCIGEGNNTCKNNNDCSGDMSFSCPPPGRVVCENKNACENGKSSNVQLFSLGSSILKESYNSSPIVIV